MTLVVFKSLPFCSRQCSIKFFFILLRILSFPFDCVYLGKSPHLQEAVYQHTDRVGLTPEKILRQD